MKIVCDSAKLAKLCMNVQRTVSSKSTIPAIEGILIDALGDSIRLTGYDLEVGTETYLEAEVEENGSIILKTFAKSKAGKRNIPSSARLPRNIRICRPFPAVFRL